MKTNRTARRYLGLLGLSFILTLGTAHAAPTRTQNQPALRPAASRTTGARLAPRRVTLNRSTPAPVTARREWSAFVQTEVPQIPAITRENYGPFGVWQNRRFERGETLVPPSVNTF